MTTKNYLYKVEKGVPIPPPATTWREYPFEVMDVGDSFVFPLEHKSAVRSARSTFYKKQGRKKEFAIRIGGSNLIAGKKVGRIWRIK